MEDATIISLVSLGITALTLLTTFVLGLEKRKLKNLERKNKSYKTKLKLALVAIQGYQEIESQLAVIADKNLPSYRADIRKDCDVYFDSAFVAPGNIEELIQRLDA